MKIAYYFKVFFISYEFVFLLLGWGAYFICNDPIAAYYSKITLNDGAVSWAMLLPATIVGWTLKEGVHVIFPEKMEKFLHEWPEYWKLKAHFDIGLFNCVIYSIPCLLIWLFGALNTFVGAWGFLIFAVALSINAFSFYNAKINVKSALIKISK